MRMGLMDDLVAWLREQIDEDERVAQSAAVGGGWRYSGGDSVGGWTLYDEHWEIAHLKTYPHGEYDYAGRMPAVRQPYYVDADANGTHIARHDPARVLREVEAKRLILDQYEDVVRRVRNPVSADAWAAARVGQFELEGVVRLLAHSLADRTGYRDEWRP